MTLTAEWLDRGRKPQCPPNPDFPYGKAIDVSEGAADTCEINLKCPTPRCGFWMVKCSTCGYSVIVTTAGRPDDPCKIKVPCQPII